MNSGTSNEKDVPLVIEHAALSSVGMRRGNNQDALSVLLAGDRAEWQRGGHFFMVADGMGAHAAGELASKLATDTVPHLFGKNDLPVPLGLRKAVEETNRIIYQKGQSSNEFQGMGTTCSCLVLHGEGASVAHVGDSRVYRLRNGVLEQLTFDHSLVWEMAAAGKTSEENVPAYVPKNVITRSLGPNADVNVDIEGPWPIAEGDVYLLCSDGLTGPVGDTEIGTIAACLGTEKAVQTLIDLANLRGGPDNITIVAARVVERANDVPTGGRSRGLAVEQSASFGERLLVGFGGLALVAALAFAWQDSFLAAAIAGVVGLASLGIALIRRLEGPAEVGVVSQSGPFGRGPYRRYDCRANRDFVDRLRKVVADLAKLSEEREWQICWDDFHQLSQQAESATTRDDLSEAVVAYCQAIRDVMAQLREQGRVHPSDSDILA